MADCDQLPELVALIALLLAKEMLRRGRVRRRGRYYQNGTSEKPRRGKFPRTRRPNAR